MGDLTLESLSARLDKQAAAIRALREQVRALTDAGTVQAPASQPGYVPSPLCLVCGEAKEAGRSRTLTCAGCAARWNAGIKGTGPRLTFDACVHCHAAKPTSTKMLCPTCSGAFKVWKAQQ